MFHNLREGAIFIADAHYPHFGDDLVKILEAIDSKEIATSQLILMGDIFDLLFGCGEYIKSFSYGAIELLNHLSKSLEIIYLEGNHDFYLKSIFQDITIYPRELQPVEFGLGKKRVMLSHGDRFDTGLIYDIYSYLIRNPILLNSLKVAERFIIDKNIERLKLKKICRGEFIGFDKKVKSILSHYPEDVDLVIEGHFHQGVKLKKYISLPSLVCQKKVAIVRGEDLEFVDIDTILKVDL